MNLSVWALSLANSSSISSYLIASSTGLRDWAISSFLFNFFSSFNKGVSNPAESSMHIPFTASGLSFCSSLIAYLILIPFVSTLYPVGISEFTIFDNKYDFPTLFIPKTPILMVSSLTILS